MSASTKSTASYHILVMQSNLNLALTKFFWLDSVQGTIQACGPTCTDWTHRLTSIVTSVGKVK